MNLETLAEFTQFGRVFPLSPNSKIPMKRWNWREQNSDDLEIIAEWLEQYPDANWGLIPVRALVVDVDTKDGAQGPESIEQHGGLDPTFTVVTPSGGRHHYYYAPTDVLPFITKNKWLPGVDIRYGDAGFVVLPYSKTKTGSYRIETDLDQLELAEDKLQHASHQSILPVLPEWIQSKLINEISKTDSGVSGSLSDPDDTDIPLLVAYSECDKSWEGIRDRVKYMFFRNQSNARIWNRIPVATMKDRSQSGFENQLAIRLMNVGATDEEIRTAYRVWCGKHKLKRKNRFYSHIVPDARLVTAEYIERWKASQPVTRKWGTTTDQVLEAIRSGASHPRAIVDYTGLKGSAVRMHLKRLCEAGKLIKTDAGYAIAEPVVAQDESVAA